MTRRAGEDAAPRRIAAPSWSTTLVLAAAALLTAACDNPAPVAPGGSGGAPGDPAAAMRGAGSGSPERLRTGGLSAVPVFEIALDVRGAMRPGVPIELFGDIEGRLPSAGADLRLSLPEVARARERGPAGFRVPVGRDVPAQDGRSGPVGRGQLRQLHASVTIPDPGYYRVSLTAVDTETPEEDLLAASDGAHVQSHDRLEKWLFVSEEGGQITDDFRPELIPDNFRPQPGPFRNVKEDGGPVDRSPDDADGAGTSEASIGGWVRAGVEALLARLKDDVTRSETAAQPYRYRVVYWLDGSYRPVEGALVRVSHVPDITGLGDAQQIIRRTKRTDSQGRLTVDCFVGYDYFTVDVRARSTGFSVVPERFGQDAGDYVDCGNSVNLDRQLIAQSDQAHLFRNMRKIVPASRSLLQRSRGRVRLFLDVSVSVSQYDLDNDVILMKASEPNHIFGSFGLFTAAHEYGHAVHHKALGGINPGHAENCSPHFVPIRSSLGCALAEGFADYHAVATAGSGASFFRAIRMREFAVVDSPRADAAEAEGPVASVLFDITDTGDDGGETHDRIDYPGSYVSQIMETCSNLDGRADGMDFIVYCFEQGIREEVVSHTNPEFFFARDQNPIFAAESATEPSAWRLADIRDVWLHDLYDLLGPLDGGGSGGGGGGDGGFCVPEPPALKC